MGIKPKRVTTKLKHVSAGHYKLHSADFGPAAIEVVETLQSAGYQAYIVGGGVRDLLLGELPKDFDVATNAKPEEVKKLFRRCFLVGRRFRLAHVHIKNDVVEVATFRAEHHKGPRTHGHMRGGMIVRDNIYGTLEDDAVRRDFTINALYYDPSNNTILDYTDGLADLEQKQLRIIGEAKQRYREDPIRILRALRLASKLNLRIEAKTAEPLTKLAPLLHNVPPARLAEEMPKIFLSQRAPQALKNLIDYELFPQLFPATNECIKINEKFHHFINLALTNSAERLQAGKTANFSFLLAVFLWHPLQDQIKIHTTTTPPKSMFAFDKASRFVLQEQSKHVLITRRYNETIRDIWRIQYILERRRPRYIRQLIHQPGFRAAYDFLLLRRDAGEPLQRVATWWTDFIAANKDQQEEMIEKLAKPRKR